jgi:hypothetical protein
MCGTTLALHSPAARAPVIVIIIIYKRLSSADHVDHGDDHVDDHDDDEYDDDHGDDHDET